MSYSQLFTNKNEIKIPTVFSFVFVGIIIFFIARFFLDTANFSRASKKEIARFEVTNIFPNQATIFWQTDQKKTGWIIYGTNKNRLDRIGIDEKDDGKTKKAYMNHYVILQNLQENTQYSFKFIVNNQLVEKDTGQPFTFKTISNKIGVNNLQPAYGKVVNQQDQPVENAIVLLFINDAYTLSALSKNSGEWLIPLNYIINNKTQQLKSLAKNEIVRIQIVDEAGQNSNITTNLTSLSPLAETVKIGKDYDFLKKNDVLSAISNNNIASSPIDIIFPKENATIPGGNPLIKGKALPNYDLTISVKDGKSTTSMQSKANSSGTWQVTLPQQLSVGAHQVVLRTKDANGNTLTKVRNFSIAKSGEKVLGEATDSATPTVTQTPAPTSTLPTSTTPIPTAPVTGGSITYLGLSSAALVLLGLGLLVLF